MKQFTKEDARRIQREIATAIDRIDDDYSIAEFQQEVYNATGKYVKIHDTFLSLHKPICMTAKTYTNHEGLTVGVSGTYGRKELAVINYNGHFSERLMSRVKAVASTIK